MWCFAGPRGFVYVLCHVSWVSKIPHFGVAHAGGGYDPQIWTRQRFLCNAPTHKLYHPVFTHSEVMLTNKQILAKTSNVLRYAATLGTKNVIKCKRTNWMKTSKCMFCRWVSPGDYSDDQHDWTSGGLCCDSHGQRPRRSRQRDTGKVPSNWTGQCVSLRSYVYTRLCCFASEAFDNLPWTCLSEWVSMWGFNIPLDT